MIVRRRCTRRRHKLLVGLGRFKKRESSDCCVAFASSRGRVHARQRNRSAASNIWATPFHICRLLDAQGLFANATISQRAALFCSDFAPIRNRRLTKRAELVDGALTFVSVLGTASRFVHRQQDRCWRECLLSRALLGAKRTWPVAMHMSAFDPKRTWSPWRGYRKCMLPLWTTVQLTP